MKTKKKKQISNFLLFLPSRGSGNVHGLYENGSQPDAFVFPGVHIICMAEPGGVGGNCRSGLVLQLFPRKSSCRAFG